MSNFTPKGSSAPAPEDPIGKGHCSALVPGHWDPRAKTHCCYPRRAPIPSSQQHAAPSQPNGL